VRVRGPALAPHAGRRAPQRLRVLGSAICVASFLLIARVQADDWLAVLPDPNAEHSGTPQLALVYPQTDLPALVSAGDALSVRLQLPAALTPPPGVQQERALRGFSAELIGAGIELGGEHSQRYVLPIWAIRPDAGTTLIYRVRLAVPAYAAPGTYAIALRTPFGERRAERAVRVLARGATPRIARCQQPSAAGAWLASLPIDLWVCPDANDWPAVDPLLGLPTQPLLSNVGSPLALRVGKQLWLRGSASELATIEPALQAAEQTEALTRIAADAWPLMAAVVEQPDETRIERAADGLSIDNRGSDVAREIPLLLPASASLRGDANELSLYPASHLMVSQMRSVVGLLHVAAHARVAVSLGPAAVRSHAIGLQADRIESGRLGRVRVVNAPPDARIAFEYGTTGSAFLQSDLRVSLGGPLEQPVRALVMPRAGGAELVRTRLNVEPHRPPSCDTQPGRFGASSAALLLFAGMVLLKRRSRGGFGNRLGPP
jgi:hypothetical protein